MILSSFVNFNTSKSFPTSFNIDQFSPFIKQWRQKTAGLWKQSHAWNVVCLVDHKIHRSISPDLQMLKYKKISRCFYLKAFITRRLDWLSNCCRKKLSWYPRPSLYLPYRISYLKQDPKIFCNSGPYSETLQILGHEFVVVVKLIQPTSFSMSLWNIS